MARQVQKMVMRQSDVNSRLKLLHYWDYQCILCGCTFRDIASVTFEHIQPKSLSGKKNKKRRGASPDFAPSHYNCNQFRQNWSLLRAIALLRRHRKRLGEVQFYQWINKAVPNRIIAPEFMAVETVPPPPALPGFEFIRLPTFLPGMR